MAKLILIRHGQSIWNKKNLFTGWVDIPLSQEGIEESYAAGKKIAHLPIDLIFVSSLIRAQMTAMLAMLHHASGKIPRLLHSGEGKLDEWAKIYSREAEALCIPTHIAWELNERMYGELQGLNKQEMMDLHGKERVQMWRRSFDTAPPKGESLAMTAARAIPYFEEKIVPHIAKGKNVLISAHGNSLRSIMMKLDNLSKEEVVHLELATGDPIVYDFAHGKWSKQA
jgi:2,3-bisphosphoglycerate-dependent phosphoglycerate mutase